VCIATVLNRCQYRTLKGCILNVFTVRIQTPLVAILAATAMVGWLNGAALSPFLPDMAHDLGSTVPRMGQATSILFFLAAGISLFIGPLADARGTRRLMVGGLLAVVVCAIGTALATNYWMLVGVRMTGAFAAGTLGGLSMAVAAARFEGNQQRRAIGWVTAGVAGGAIVGIPLLTAIGAVAGWRAAFVAIAGAALILAALMRAALPDDTRRDAINPRSMLSAYVPLANSANMKALYLASGLRSIGWMGFLVYAGAFFKDQHGLNIQEIGWTYMIGGLSFFMGIRIAGDRLDNRPLRPIFVGTTTFTSLAVGAMLTLPIDVFTALALLTCAAFTLGISGVCISTLLAAETPAGRGTTMSLNAAVLELATAGGGAIGGLLIALGGFTTLGAGLTLFTLLAALTVQLGARLPKAALAPASQRG
jgi:predicted MFS family arabinose efflux permease